MTVMLPQHLYLCTPTSGDDEESAIGNSSSACCATVSPGSHACNPTATIGTSTSSSSSSSSSNPYLIDQLRFMLEQETSLYQASDYLQHNVSRSRRSSGNQQPSSSSYAATATVTASDRHTMITWSYDIVDACSIPREVAVIGASYFDRFLSTTSSSSRARSALVSRREFQLAFIACLILALKCRAGMQVDSDFVSDTICRGLYDPDEIVGMEAQVLDALQWRLNGPSPHEFVGGLLELLPAHARVKEQMRAAAAAQIESAVVDYDLAVSTTASSVAYAALTTAMSNVSTGAFHPLDRLSWARDIACVTGLGADAALVVSASSHAVSRPSTPPTPTVASSAVYDGYYCSPVSSGASTASTSASSATSSARTQHDVEGQYEELYRTALKRAGSNGSTGSGMSPVCAMFQDAL